MDKNGDWLVCGSAQFLSLSCYYYYYYYFSSRLLSLFSLDITNSRVRVSFLLPSSSFISRASMSMEEVTEAVSNLNISETHKKNRIQVSNTKKPLFFYVNLAKVSSSSFSSLILSQSVRIRCCIRSLSDISLHYDGLLIGFCFCL